MLFLPKGSLPPKMSGAGYARGHASAGHWLRARASVVNPNTDAMSRWRQVFIAAKMNFLATQSGGANTAPINGITPAEAWFYLSATYIGILLPGLFEGDIQLMQTMVGCATVEAFEVMISTILAQLDMPTPIGPTMTTAKAAASGGTVSATAGNATLAVSPGANAQVGPITAIYGATLTISGFTMPTVPAPSGSAWSTSQTVVNQFAMLPNSTAQGNLLSPVPLLIDEVPGPYTNTVTGLPDGVTCALSGIPLPGPFWLASPMVYGFTVTASPDAPPGTYQASFATTGPGGTYSYNFVVVILDPNVYTYALSFSGLPAGAAASIDGFVGYPLNGPTPASLEGLPHGTHTTFALSFNAAASTLTGNLFFDLTIDPSTTAGTYTFGATLTGGSSAPSVSPQLTVTTVSQQVGQPCPPFQIGSLAAHTVYDGDWNVIGFSLSPSFQLSEFNDPSQGAGYSYAFAWLITASPSYSSGYAAPLASKWRTILATGPDLPTPAQLKAAWEDVFGPLPLTGKMKIELQWVDPFTGAPGPQTAHTLSWKTGTSTGAATPQQGWPLPAFDPTSGTAQVIAPGDTAITFTLSAGNHYTGTIKWSVSPASYINTGTPPGVDKLPTGLTAAFSNTEMVFVDGVPDNGSTTLTLTATAGAQAFQGNIDVKITDDVVTDHSMFTINVVGVVTAQPPFNFLGLSPTTTEIYTATSSVTALLFELFNSGPDDFDVSMLTTNTDPDYTIEFGQGDTCNAYVAGTVMAFELATGAAQDELVGQLLTTTGYSPQEYNVTDAVIVSNDGTKVGVQAPLHHGVMTTAGIAAIINNALTVPAGTLTDPGTATVLAFFEVAAVFTAPTPQIQIVASANKNTTYSIVNTTSNPGNGFQMSPLISYVNQPVPGTSTVTIYFSNTNPAPITATLTPYSYGNGLTVTPASSPITIPAASGNIPGTTSVNVTITTTAEADLTAASPFIQAIAGSYSQTASIVFTDTQYGPLYLSLSPVNLAPANGQSQSATLTVNNASAATATVVLTPSYVPSGFTITVVPGTVTVGPGTTGNPTTGTATVTVSVASGPPITTGQLGVNGAASGYNEITVPLCLPYIT